MEINRDNRTVQSFQDVSPSQKLTKIDNLYSSLSLDINSLMEILLTVASEVILCPSNGKWRFVATIGRRKKQIAIFFPWIFSKAVPCATKPPKELAIGISGEVKPQKVIRFCQQIARVLEKNAPK